VSRIVTNSDIRNVGDTPELLNAFDGGDLVRDVFYHDPRPREGADLRDHGVSVLERNRCELVVRITKVHDNVGWRDVIRHFQRAFDLVNSVFAMPAFGSQWRYPCPFIVSTALHEWQVYGWRRQGILRKPSPDRPQETPVVKIQVRAVAKKLEALVPGLSDRFQKIDRDRGSSVDLCGYPELHDREIV
jgi:hypothetical protein